MVRLTIIALVAILGVGGTTFAADAPAPPKSQQQVMKDCNAAASSRTLKGDARKTFMSSCLSGDLSQQTMMKVCNAEATQEKMSSDARKAYLSTCLKKSG